MRLPITIRLCFLALLVCSDVKGEYFIITNGVMRQSAEGAALWDTIVIGRAIDLSPKSGDSDLPLLTIEIEEALKGSANGRIIVGCQNRNITRFDASARRLFWLETREHWQSRWDPVLVPGSTPPSLPKWASFVMPPERDNGAELSERPLPTDLLYRIRSLDSYPITLSAVKSGNELLEVIRGELAHPPSSSPGWFVLHIAPGSKGISAPGLEKQQYLPMRIDERLVPAALRWIDSPEPQDRYNAVTVLAHFRTEASVAALRRLLADPFTADEVWPPPAQQGSSMRIAMSFDERKWRHRGHPLRRLAHGALKDWGLTPEAAVFATSVYRPAYPGAAAMVAPLVCIVIVVITIFFTGWLRRGLWAGISSASILLLFASLGLYVRSRMVIDEIAFFDRGKARWEVASLDGILRVIRFESFEFSGSPEFTSVRLDEGSLRDWTPARPSSLLTRLAGVNEFRVERAGLVRARSVMWLSQAEEPFTGVVRPYALWSISYWWMVLLFALVPASRLGMAAVRRMRRKQGHCPQCGYDLRASGERCPECGVAR